MQLTGNTVALLNDGYFLRLFVELRILDGNRSIRSKSLNIFYMFWFEKMRGFTGEMENPQDLIINLNRCAQIGTLAAVVKDKWLVLAYLRNEYRFAGSKHFAKSRYLVEHGLDCMEMRLPQF